MSNPKLAIELVPLNSWEENVRTVYPTKVWDRLRRITYKRAKHRCEICGESGLDQGQEHPVECHEIWVIDDEKKIQTLGGLVSLCPLCHEVKHAGRTVKFHGVAGLRRILQRLSRVNDWTEDQAKQHLQDAFVLWESRSNTTYTLDLSWLEPSTPRSSVPVYE